MIKISCTSLFNGNASVGSHIFEECDSKKETIQITHKKQVMTIKHDHFFKFFSFGNTKSYPHQDGRTGFYTLKYVKFVPEDK